MVRPRPANISSIRVATASSRSRGTFKTSAMRVTGDVVLGRPQPATADQGVAASQSLADGGDNAGLVVADLDL